MNFGQAIGVCFSKYATFSGRAQRSEYWYFMLFAFIAYIAAIILDAIFSGAVLGDFGTFFLLAGIAMTLPQLAVLVRRLHDMDRSGWWALLLIVPSGGPVILLIWMTFKGSDGQNPHGPDPLDRVDDGDSTLATHKSSIPTVSRKD